MKHPFRIPLEDKLLIPMLPTSQCPCGSGKVVSVCCSGPTGFKKLRAETTPKGQLTGKEVAKCYARSDKNCDGVISREHYISQVLLHHINKNNGLFVNGFRWQKEEPLKVSPGSLVGNCLCERHNSALSELDAIAIRLFDSFDWLKASNAAEDGLYLFNGHDVERWMLKVLCGMIAAKCLRTRNVVLEIIPKNWIQILFGKMEFANRSGLFVRKTKGLKVYRNHEIEILPLVYEEQIQAMVMRICGFELFLMLSDQFDGKICEEEALYRPMELHTVGNDWEQSIVFSWDGPADFESVTYRMA